MRGRINVEADNVVLSAVIDHREKLLNAKRFIIVACGTSWHAGLIGKHLIESFCRIPVEVEYASEFRYRDPILPENTLVVIVSQSGETADTLAALRLAKEKGVRTLGIVNVVGSSIAREADNVMYTWSGDRCCDNESVQHTAYRAVPSGDEVWQSTRNRFTE